MMEKSARTGTSGHGSSPPFLIEGDEGRAKRCISARSDLAAFTRTEVRRGGRKGARLHLKKKKTKRDFVSLHGELVFEITEMTEKELTE